MERKQQLVWDLPLRLFHWLLVISIMLSWYTSEQEGEMIELHMKSGYLILALVIFRVIWGFAGTKHSRFSQFYPSPSRLITYINEQKRGIKNKHAGHNPLGSLMIFLMIILILLQSTSGLFINDDIFSAGPYYGTLSAEMEKVMQFIHHNVFNLIIGAIFMHLSAIVYYRFTLKTDLVTPMFTGTKSADDIHSNDAISHSKILVAIIIALAVAAFIYWLVVINVPVEEEYFY